MTIDQLKNLLQHYSLSPNKTYGQNFMLDETILFDMVDASGITKDDVVLEIGPGIGNLTEQLAQHAKQVVTIEKDPKFIPILKSITHHHKNVWYEIADILHFNFQERLREQGSYRVVANVPYYITGKIVQLFLQADFKPKSMTFLIQKEVAQNIVAQPGQLNLLAISVQLYGKPKLVRIVEARNFYPAPKVDSAIIQIDLYEKPKYQIDDEKKLFRILRACFSGKRKQLHNTLVNNLHLEKTVVDAVLQQLNIDPKIRPQQLTIEQWIGLTKKLPV